MPPFTSGLRTSIWLGVYLRPGIGIYLPLKIVRATFRCAGTEEAILALTFLTGGPTSPTSDVRGGLWSRALHREVEAGRKGGALCCSTAAAAHR